MQLMTIGLINSETFVACKAGGIQDARTCLLCPPPYSSFTENSARMTFSPTFPPLLQTEGAGEIPAKLIRAVVSEEVTELLLRLDLGIYHLLLK